MRAGGLSVLVLTLDTGQPFDKTDLLRRERVRGIASFLPRSLLRDRPQQIEVALSAKLLQTAFPLPHGSDADRPRLPDIAHGGGHLSRDAIEASTDIAMISPRKSCHMPDRLRSEQARALWLVGDSTFPSSHLGAALSQHALTVRS